jgi:hypothetical protein
VTDATFEHWFDARRLYASGVPPEVTTALSSFAGIRAEVEQAVQATWAARPGPALEIGPGTQPTLGEGQGPRCFVDLAPGFLAPLAGLRVVAQALTLPFQDRAFSLAVANDVLTHVPPQDREQVLAELCRVAYDVLLFSPEPGTPEVVGSSVSTPAIVAALEEAGRTVTVRRFVARAKDQPDFSMAQVVGQWKPRRRRKTVSATR